MLRILILTALLGSSTVSATPSTPGSPPAPKTGKVQVFILMGQSNMLGMAPLLNKGGENGLSLETVVKTNGLFPYLWDNKTSDWAVSPNVRNVGVMGSGNVSFGKAILQHNEFMTVNATVKPTVGPELGIGWTLGNSTDEPIMILKSCIGGRSLGWDLLPPGSPEEDYTDPKTNKTITYAGYHQSPEKWTKGTTPKPIGWMAGEQYDGDTADAAHILANIGDFYPGATEYEIKGFFWWQGAKDAVEDGLSAHYEKNLAHLITTVRAQFKAPDAKFVAGTLGQTVKGATTNDGLILDAIFSVDGTSGKYPQFKDNVAGVYTHPYSMGGVAGSHYNYNAQTYMQVGQALGAEMVKMLKADSQ